MGNSAHSVNPAQRTGHYLTQTQWKCSGFLVSTYSKLWHVTWRPTILLRCLGEQQSARDRCSDRRPFEKRRHCKWRLTDKRRTKKLENRHIQTASRWPLRYKGIQWAELRAVLWLNHFHTLRRSCARASGEELEELATRRKMSWTFSTRWRVFARKNGYHCLLYSAYFRLDSSIHPVSTL